MLTILGNHSRSNFEKIEEGNDPVPRIKTGHKQPSNDALSKNLLQTLEKQSLQIRSGIYSDDSEELDEGKKEYIRNIRQQKENRVSYKRIVKRTLNGKKLKQLSTAIQFISKVRLEGVGDG